MEMRMDAINAIEVEPSRECSSYLETIALEGLKCENIRNVKSDEV